MPKPKTDLRGDLERRAKTIPIEVGDGGSHVQGTATDDAVGVNAQVGIGDNAAVGGWWERSKEYGKSWGLAFRAAWGGSKKKKKDDDE